MRELRIKNSRSVRWGLAAAGLAAGLALWPVVAPQAQRSNETPVNVTGVTAHQKGADAVVSIAGDGALSRAQTWQDDEGFHVVVYKGQNALRSGLPRGVKARRVGDSLEFVVPVKAGGSVYVQPRNNQLDLIVGGGLRSTSTTGDDDNDDARLSAHAARSSVSQQQTERAAQMQRKERAGGEPSDTAAGAREGGKQRQAGAQESVPSANGRPQTNRATAMQSGAQTHAQVNAPQQQSQTSAPPAVPAGAAPRLNILPGANAPVVVAEPPVDGPAAPPSEVSAEQSQVGAQLGATSTSGLKLPLVVLGLCFTGGLVAFLFIYRRQRGAADAGWEDVAAEETSTALTAPAPKALSKTNAKTAEPAVAPRPHAVGLEPHPHGERRRDERRKNWGRRAADKLQGIQPAAPAPQPVVEKHERRPISFTSAPSIIFGAYRIDQEVEKLLQGQPHSIEVLAARGADDRRAVETSLIKALQSNMLGDEERRRARLALEEYGFVARQSATLLLANEAYERTMAARVLGQIRSAAAMPFLLEALHDPEHVVCTEAVTSLGALGLPSAIGALLDLARRHPELPVPLFASALSACSVDCIDVYAEGDGPNLLGDSSFTGDIDGLEPVGEIEQLPEWLEDQTLAEALERLGNVDVEARTHAAQQLAQFQVRRTVDALAALASDDRDATVRATAVTSLGIIGHESVFASVLIGMADEAREVRAAAARALSRLGFDRADAYVRVIESGDEAQARRLAQACTKAGLTAKALDRLASEDRRQAYEAFSLLSLVLKAGEVEVIFEAVERPGELSVRLAAARLLALQGLPEFNRRLRRVALGDGAPEKLRTAILEAIYRDDHAPVE